MDTIYSILRVLHILAVVFMAWPLYALISVNERKALGAPLGSDSDTYMENIIKGQSRRCFIFQATAGITGVVLLLVNGMGLIALLGSWVLMAKTLLLFVVIGLLSYVINAIQPQVDALFGEADRAGGTFSADLSAAIGRLRLRRKRLAGLCLFLVITMIILGLQVYSPFYPWLTIALLILAGLFSWRAYRGPIKFGWI
jgi:hypothetical protein